MITNVGKIQYDDDDTKVQSLFYIYAFPSSSPRRFVHIMRCLPTYLLSTFNFHLHQTGQSHSHSPFSSLSLSFASSSSSSYISNRRILTTMRKEKKKKNLSMSSLDLLALHAGGGVLHYSLGCRCDDVCCCCCCCCCC